jgi:glycosyltransferase involved in cell wall biosynthesis
MRHGGLRPATVQKQCQVQPSEVQSIPASIAPLVSVIIPTFNRPEYLRLALQSVVNQTCRDLEIIIHDNASRIDPSGVVAAFGDPRIHYWRNPATVSVTANVTAACSRARGKYLALLGDDDLWYPDFLETLVAPLERDDDLVLAFCDHEIIGPEGNKREAETEKVSRGFQRHRLREGIYKPFDEIALVDRSICVLTASVLRRSDIDLKGVPGEIGSGPLDHYLAYLATRTAKGCFYTPRRLAQYRYHSGSLNMRHRTPREHIDNSLAAMCFWRALLNDRALKRSWHYFQMKIAYNALRVIVSLARCGDWRGAWQQLRRFWHEGALVPRIVLYHLHYALRLHRLRA